MIIVYQRGVAKVKDTKGTGGDGEAARGGDTGDVGGCNAREGDLESGRRDKSKKKKKTKARLKRTEDAGVPSLNEKTIVVEANKMRNVDTFCPAVQRLLAFVLHIVA